MSHKTIENIVIIVLVITIICLLFGNTKTTEKRVTFSDKQCEIELDRNLIDEFTSDKHDKDSDDIIGYDGTTDYEELDKIVKEYRDFGRFEKNDQNIPKATSMEIDSYRKSFLDFRNYVGATSNGFDAVDSINLEKVQEISSQGARISEVYDRMTAPNYKWSNIDVVGMQHNEKIDEILKSDEFRYDSDTVNNGGIFFDKVTGYDNKTYEHTV